MTPGLTVTGGVGDAPIVGSEGVGVAIPTGTGGVDTGELKTGGRLGDGRTGLTAGRAGDITGTEGRGVGDGRPATEATCPSIAALVKWAEAEIGKNRTAAEAYASTSTGVRSNRHGAWYLPHPGEPCTQFPSPLPFEPSAKCDKTRTSRQ
jgi:hypothetical protein